MSPLDPDHFADMDGNAIEDARLSRCRAYSAAAEPINWSLSDGARRTIRTPPAMSDVSSADQAVPGRHSARGGAGWNGRQGWGGIACYRTQFQ
jgi:hypothetical protein